MSSRAPLRLIPNWRVYWEGRCFGHLVYNRRPTEIGTAGTSHHNRAELMATKDQALKPDEEKRLPKPALALLQSLRIRQCVKNGLVFLPFLFAVNQVWAPDNLAAVPQTLLDLAGVFWGFCALSSAVYLLNDLADREEDRRHPGKRHRAIASGQLPVPGAVVLSLILVAVGLALMGLNRPLLVGVGLLYLVINLTYSLGAKRLVLVDVMLVASGYVIRAAAGALAINVSPSPWLYAVTAAGALFIVLGRRYAEVRLAGDDLGGQRPVLLAYRGPLIGQLLGIAATAALVEKAREGGKATIIDTRKTTPGLRALEKYAVTVGGGVNHRFGLSDGVLLKDNHLAVLARAGISLKEALVNARRLVPHTVKMEIEVETVKAAREAMAAGAELLLLDNMSLEDMREVVALAPPGVLTEASGNITLDRVAEIAATGVDLVSSGAVTHSSPAIDISLDFQA